MGAARRYGSRKGAESVQRVTAGPHSCIADGGYPPRNRTKKELDIMGRKRNGKDGRRGAGGRAASPRDQRGSDVAQRASAGGTQGPSRLLLTRLLRDGAIWEVHIATTARTGAPNLTLLEFEGTGTEQEKLCYTRPVEGSLLAALHSGTPVSRASLEEELELAFRDAGAVDGGDAAPVSTEPSDSAAADPLNGR